METGDNGNAVELRGCRLSPGYYRICHSNLCLPRDELCPCSDTEVRCGVNGTCIPQRLWCDGKQHCSNGEDEAQCQYPKMAEESSLPVLLGLVCGVALVIIIIVLLLVMKYWKRHQARKKSNSANDPLNPDSENFLAHACHSQPNSSSESDNAENLKKTISENGLVVKMPLSENVVKMPLPENIVKMPLPEIIKSQLPGQKNASHSENVVAPMPYSVKYQNNNDIFNRSFKNKSFSYPENDDMKLLEPNRNNCKVQRHSVPYNSNTFNNNLNNILSSDFGSELLCTSTPRQKAKQYARPISVCDIPAIKIGGDLGARLNLSTFENIT